MEEELGFQNASFTLPPNRSSATEPRRIYIISDDSDTHENDTDEEKAQRLYHNEIRADMRCNDGAIDRANHDLENAERRNPRNRRSPIRPRNLDADFVLNYNGQDIFATPSANLAVVFQVLEGLPETPEIIKARARLHVAAMQAQQLREDNSAYRAQSSHHSTRPHGDDGEVNQNDLHLQLNQQDLCQRIDNRHRQRDAAERERHHQYDEEHGLPDADH